MRVMNEAERALVEAHLGLVETILRRHITPQPETPGMEHNDLFQVGSLALCHAAQRYDGRCQFSTFAYVVVRNALLDHCRRAAGKPVISLDKPLPDSEGTLLDVLPDPAPAAPERYAETNDLLRALTRAGRRYRGVARKGVKAIEMQIFGYSTQEIAALYGVRSNVVAAWVSRARRMLKSEYMMTAE